MTLVDIKTNYDNENIKKKFYVDKDFYPFPYVILLKAINGEINDSKAKRLLKSYFKYRKNKMPNINHMFPRRGNKQLKLFSLYGSRCVFCGINMVQSKSEFDNQVNRVSIEHILPKSEGGTNRMDNLCLSCNRCNSNKQSNIIPL